MLRRLTRTGIRFVILLLLVFLGLSYYFRHVTNFRATELASYHTVLQNMVDAGLISKARSSQIFQQPIHLKSLGH